MGTDDDEKLAEWRLRVLVGRIYGVQERDETTFPAPVPKSRLADADAKLDPFPITNAVQQLLAVSGDNLHAVGLLLHKAETHQPFAPYTLGPALRTLALRCGCSLVDLVRELR